jgi:prefoldin subunit 5
MSAPSSKGQFLARLGRWAAELILVFVGVYAAFWLNSYQQHQQDLKRRDQILASLEEDVQRKVSELTSEAMTQDKEATDFAQKLSAGEMPTLQPLDWATGYNPGDIAAFLQAGGLDLLDVKTIASLRRADRDTRRVLSRMLHYQQLSDTLIAPNLDQDTGFFYDPGTKKLRKRFANYPDILAAGANAMHQLASAYADLLTQLRSEQAKR